MEYTILYGFEADALERAVAEQINEGWRPRGGVAVMPDDSGPPRFAQSMVRSPLLSMLEVQTILKKLNYDPGPIDGKMGKKTLDALNALRRLLKMPRAREYDRSSDNILRSIS